MSERKTAVVTSAVNGIGRALASRLSVDGYRLCLIDMDRTALDAAAEVRHALSGFSWCGGRRVRDLTP